MSAFDASVLVPLFHRGHPNHEQARRRFREAKEVLLHPAVLAETARVIRRSERNQGGDGNAVARAAIKALLQEPRCRLVPLVDYEEAFERFANNSKLSLVDSFVVQVAIDASDEPPTTSDAAMTKVWKTAVTKRAKES